MQALLSRKSCPSVNIELPEGALNAKKIGGGLGLAWTLRLVHTVLLVLKQPVSTSIQALQPVVCVTQKERINEKWKGKGIVMKERCAAREGKERSGRVCIRKVG